MALEVYSDQAGFVPAQNPRRSKSHLWEPDEVDEDDEELRTFRVAMSRVEYVREYSSATVEVRAYDSDDAREVAREMERNGEVEFDYGDREYDDDDINIDEVEEME